MKAPGEKPPQLGPFRRELIGPPECPILYRWTLLSSRFGKLLVHRFLPNADDRAIYDHPSPFVTLVLSGGYDDLIPDERTGGKFVRVGDRMRRGSVRYRSATHRHRTQVLPSGAWTLVLMGPKKRQWGFWRDGRFWLWEEFERRFGYGMRCPDD